MDLDIHQNWHEKNSNPPYEFVMDQDYGKNHLHRSSKLKQKVLSLMTELEGWCSSFKAVTLIDLILLLKPNKVVEIGVFGGKSFIPMAMALKSNGAGMIYGVDPYDSQASIQGMEGANKKWWGSIDHQLILDGFNKKIKDLNLQQFIRLLRETSKNSPIVQDIDLLHIDGNPSEETALIDVLKWVPLVRKGGVIVINNLHWNPHSKAVDWLNQNCIKLAEFNEDNSWGLWIAN